MTPLIWYELFRDWGMSKGAALRLGHACHHRPGAVLRAIHHQTVDSEAETVKITKGES
jgi:hypothetical protein